MITVVSHKPKNKWAPVKFTIRGIPREKLALLLTLAIEAGEAPGNETCRDMVALAKEIDRYIHADGMVRANPLEIESY